MGFDEIYLFFVQCLDPHAVITKHQTLFVPGIVAGDFDFRGRRIAAAASLSGLIVPPNRRKSSRNMLGAWTMSAIGTPTQKISRLLLPTI